MKEKTCFIISPIGDEKSETRECADLFRSVVKEVAELHDLRAYRADEITGTSDINMDVMDSVINSDMCIVDLTGLNPNVMFEFGIRYQTKKYYVICAKTGTKLPFDMISKRTIFYDDLNITKNAKKLKDQLREYIRQAEKNDYQAEEIASLKSIYELIQTVLKKVDRISSGQQKVTVGSDNIDLVAMDERPLIRELGAAGAFTYAYESQNIQLAEKVIEYCRKLPHLENKLCALAAMGSQKATIELIKLLENAEDKSVFADVKQVIGTATSGVMIGYNDGIESLRAVFEKYELWAEDNKERAFILNQKQRLYAFEHKWNEAMQLAKKVLELDAEELGYIYNYAFTLKELNRNSEAREMMKKVANQLTDDDHLVLAYSLFIESTDAEYQNLAQSVMQKLSAEYPYKAQLLQFGILG